VKGKRRWVSVLTVVVVVVVVVEGMRKSIVLRIRARRFRGKWSNEI